VSKPFDWRAHLKVHPAADPFPLLPPDELQALADDIKKNGLRYPIILWKGAEGTFLLDGRNRLDAMALAGVPILDDNGALKHWSLREGDPYELVVSLNVHRRHMNTEQRQELLITLIVQQPEQSNRQIAKKIGVDHKTVGVARAKGEQLGRIPQLKKTVGADGKARKQPAAKPKKVKPDTAAATTNTAPKTMTAPASDIALESFDAHILELRRIIKGQKPQRFAKTAVALPLLGDLAHFIREVVAIRKLADDPTASAEQRKADYAASEASAS
jgi:hypothetical protein